MQQQYPRGIRVLVCGGGNAAHVFAGQLSARGALTTMLSTFPGEADAIKLGLNGSPSANQPAVDRGIAVRNWPLDRSGSNFGTVRGTPISVASRVESAFTPSASSTTDSMEYEYYDVIVLALPACAHDRYLASMAPYLAYPHPTRPPTVLCAAVAQGGFDLAVNASLTAAGVTSTVIIAGLEALPWACRLVSRGSECEILGSKSQVDVAVAVYTPNGSSSGVGDVGKSTAKNAADLLKRHTPRALEMLQAVVGHTPRLHLASGFLGVTLMNINSLWHPTMMYHRWYKEWDGRETFVSPPPFYEGASDDMGASAVAMSEEVVKVCDALRARYGGKGGRLLLDDLSTVRKAYDWLIRAYGDEAAMDRTSVATMLRTNPAYRGQTHPMKNLAPRDSSGPATPDVKPRLVPDYHHRYLSEDIPYGLVVTRGIAELAGVSTPTIDAVIVWAQKVCGRSYLIKAKPGGHGFSESDIPGTELRLGGEDVAQSRCPQRYGWFDLDWFMLDQGYIMGEPGGADPGGAGSWMTGWWAPGASGHLFKESHSTEDITTSEGTPSDADDRRVSSTGAAW